MPHVDLPVTVRTPGSSPGPFSRLADDIEGEVLTGRFDLGRYATDASIYQMMPRGVVVPRTTEDVRKTVGFCCSEGIPVLPRGGGTSQCGQTVNEALVIDYSRHLDGLVSLDVANRRCVVQPGMVLDSLNRILKPHGLWFPVDVSTASRATIGGMAANNSCGSRSLRYGLMRGNVEKINGLMINGESMEFGQIDPSTSALHGHGGVLVKALLELGEREKDEIARRFPRVMRRVGGYNIDALVPGQPVNLAHLLVGSEGTLACTESIELRLSPLPRNKLLGVCHFPSFHEAMDATRHLVKLDPVAVELIDRTMIELAMEIPMYRSVVDQFVRGEPEAILLVEFAEEDPRENRRRLTALGDTMSQLGFHQDAPAEKRGGVVEAVEPAFQAAIFEVRKAGLNIMMSMKEARKPISFVEDCAVALEDLAEYTRRLTEIFEKHGTRGTWYAHASVGCLHVRPVLNTRLDQDVKAMRAIAEEAFDMVLEYKGSHSGEHGDGIVRSEFHRKMFGDRMVDNFAAVKNLFDPDNLMNPGKIVNPPQMDDPALFRYPPAYKVKALDTVMDWSSWPGQGGGFQGAVEMCNNNGACRKHQGGVMCPSYRVTGNERDSVRGRANSLRLAISGQLGDHALQSDEMAETLKLCVGCKACKSECPTGVDMARMKIEVAAARAIHRGLPFREKLIAWLPVYAPILSVFSGLANLPNRLPWLARILEPLTGLAADRKLPQWRNDPYKHKNAGPADGQQVVLFADTFNTWFEPENLRAARRVLAAAGYRVISPLSARTKRPLCCGRTWLTAGATERAREEMQRLVDTLLPCVRNGAFIVGLEPSCTLGLRDDLAGLLKTDAAKKVGERVMLFEEFIARYKPDLAFRNIDLEVLLHGHCHQKAYNGMSAVEEVLGMVPGLRVETIESSCCGMAGAFGYQRETVEVSKKMAELTLLPAVRQAPQSTIVVADGTSCRHQIELGAERKAVHVARVLEMALADSDGKPA